MTIVYHHFVVYYHRDDYDHGVCYYERKSDDCCDVDYDVLHELHYLNVYCFYDDDDQKMMLLKIDVLMRTTMVDFYYLMMK